MSLIYDVICERKDNFGRSVGTSYSTKANDIICIHHLLALMNQDCYAFGRLECTFELISNLAFTDYSSVTVHKDPADSLSRQNWECRRKPCSFPWRQHLRCHIRTSSHIQRRLSQRGDIIIIVTSYPCFCAASYAVLVSPQQRQWSPSRQQDRSSPVLRSLRLVKSCPVVCILVSSPVRRGEFSALIL